MDLVGHAKQLKTSQSSKDIKKAETAEAFLTSLRGCFFYAYPAEGLHRSKSFMMEVFGGLNFSEELFSKEFWEESANNKERTKEFLYWCRTQEPSRCLMAAIEGALTKGVSNFLVIFPLKPSDSLERIRILGPGRCEFSLVLDDCQFGVYWLMYRFSVCHCVSR